MASFKKWLWPLLALIIGTAVLWLLHHELRHYDYHAVHASLRAIPGTHIAWAAALAAASYLVLTLYDVLALQQIGRSPGYPRTALTSFTAYVLSYNLGFSVVSGTAVRFRLYSTWGFSPGEIGRVVAFTAATFWLGLFSAAGIVFLVGNVALPPAWPLPMASLRPVGVVLVSIVLGYVATCMLRRRPVVIGGWTLPLPRWPIALAQAALGAFDVLLAALVVWVLMPAGWDNLPNFLGVYLLGMTAGLISHVPGGLGVLETVMVYGRPETVTGPQVLGALLIFRVIYYLAPLAIAVALLAAHEAARHRHRIQAFATEAGRWVPRIAPRLFAATTFLAGAILLLSGATPAAHGRLAWLHPILPLPVLEMSHLLGSVVGVLLLFLARGLQRRMDAAYLLTLALLAAGALFSLLKGFDWEEALILLAMFALMLPCRQFFYRKASLLEAPFTPGWIVAIVLVLAATTWIGFFAYRHVEYRNELWWRFAARADAPRFLRASVAVISVAALLGVRRLLRPATMRPAPPDAATLERAASVVDASPESVAHLALVGDKAMLFSESGRGFIMYGVEGRSWIALGDPIGPDEEREELVWAFREWSDREGGWTVFYQVGTEDLPLYLDAGLTLTKLGEEARVPLAGFSLDGSERKGLRQTVRRVEREGGSFEWIEPAGVPAVLPELRTISDAWLASRATREKGFSLGSFREDYLKRCPFGVVKKDGHIVAFANVWKSGEKNEMSVDLMRYVDDAPSGSMEFLFTQLMLRGAEEGFAWFNLGMAPLSGMENRSLAPLWHRVGALLFQHGEQFYRFQGLRAYKEKYHPIWTPRYLAAPDRLHLPLVLANVTALISSGMRGLVTK